MGKNTKIEWCDHTINLWWGCEKVHTGCKNCYAEYLSDVRYKNGLWGTDKRKEVKSAFKDLIRIQADALKAGVKQTVFIGSMMDIFEEPKKITSGRYVDTGVAREKLFQLIDLGFYPNIIFLFLTKRPENIINYIPEKWLENLPKNVWFGVSVSDQKTADEFIPELLTKIGNKFISMEPQVELVSLAHHIHNNINDIKWIIQGGESGHKRRPFNLHWANGIRSLCDLYAIPYFFKQIDKVTPIPEELNVKQFPKW